MRLFRAGYLTPLLIPVSPVRGMIILFVALGLTEEGRSARRGRWPKRALAEEKLHCGRAQMAGGGAGEVPLAKRKTRDNPVHSTIPQ
jgi:hypothetical protein